MSPHLERLVAGLARACAIGVTAVPVAAGGVLLLFAVHQVFLPSGVLAALHAGELVAFSVGVAASAAVAGGVLGIGCALAAEELAPMPVRSAIEAAIGFLGAIPAVVFGWFAVAIVWPVFERELSSGSAAYATASIVLAAMIAPTTCALTTRALRRVPDAIRQAATAAGASRLQATAMVIIPALRRKLAAAGLAAFARALGEATALQILFAVIAGREGSAPATVASWIFTVATSSPSADSAGLLCLPALLLLLVAAGCALVVGREYRGMQWA
jgi:ABC-type phosphate transport system permease subunit